jgi:1-deoxy-D-xylulose-5-phosphate reductoisomerase
VDAFLAGRLSFPGIAAVVEDTLSRAERAGMMREPASLDDAVSLDGAARRCAAELTQ